MYAEVVVNAPAPGTFHYHVPDALSGQLRPGHLVEVPFGKMQQQAIVLRLDRTSPVEETRPITRLLDAEPVVGPAHIALAEWLSRATLSHLGDCLRLFLTPGVAKRGDIEVTLLAPDAAPNTEVQKRVLSLLRRRGPTLRGRQIQRAMPHTNWRAAVAQLAGREALRSAPVLDPPSARPKTVRTARLAISPEQVPHVARFLGHESKRANVLEVLLALADIDPMPALDLVCEEAGCTAGVVRAMEENGLVGVIPYARMVSLEASSAAAVEEALGERAQAALDQLRAHGGRPVVRGDLDADSAALKALEDAGLVRRWEEPARVHLAISAREIIPAIIDLRGGRRHLEVLNFLARQDDAVDVTWVYADTGARLDDLRALAEDGLILLGEEEVIRDPLADRDFVPVAAPPLTPDQQRVWLAVRDTVDAALDADGQRARPAPILLHGVTGSGKTEIYLRAAERVARAGRQAIILVPEISLTPQTVRRFAARFPRRLGIVHSRLSEGERFDTWRRARAGELDVIVGARSALFTPLPSLGLIVLDESHDDSYKQSPPVVPPYYHARETAAELGRLCGAAVIFGTATPDLVSFYRAKRGDYTLLTLPQRVIGHRERVSRQAEHYRVAAPAYRADSGEAAPDAVYMAMPAVTVVDMRQELRAGNRSMFSRELRGALAAVLEAGEQAMLFLNRRGTATAVICRDCGYVHGCPQCSTPLIYHGPDRALVCHHCGHHEPQPRRCPECDSKHIRYMGLGTQLVEQAVMATFPSARTLRWDADTTGASKGAHEILLDHFVHGHADILIGTQMIAKGLDLPLVTLVGVVLADVGLALPDYRAHERTFQVLAQVAGRAGRGLLGGRVVLQTYRPDHYVISAAAAHDYHAFYAQEIAARRELGYPPFKRLARLVFRHPDEHTARQAAQATAAAIRQRIEAEALGATDLVGPAPCFFTRLAGQYRWQIVLRSPDPARALSGVALRPEWEVDVDPVDLL